jgi:hypothetical protein
MALLAVRFDDILCFSILAPTNNGTPSATPSLGEKSQGTGVAGVYVTPLKPFALMDCLCSE